MLSRTEKLRVLKRDKYTCYYCKCNNPLVQTVDHITPLSNGGTNEDKNLVSCCIVCNKIKGSMNKNDFNHYIKSLFGLKQLGKVSVNILNIDVNVNLKKGVGVSYDK